MLNIGAKKKVYWDAKLSFAVCSLIYVLKLILAKNNQPISPVKKTTPARSQDEQQFSKQ